MHENESTLSVYLLVFFLLNLKGIFRPNPQDPGSRDEEGTRISGQGTINCQPTGSSTLCFVNFLSNFNHMTEIGIVDSRFEGSWGTSTDTQMLSIDTFHGTVSLKFEMCIFYPWFGQWGTLRDQWWRHPIANIWVPIRRLMTSTITFNRFNRKATWRMSGKGGLHQVGSWKSKFVKYSLLLHTTKIR